jgi:hypothetical protein
MLRKNDLALYSYFVNGVAVSFLFVLYSSEAEIFPQHFFVGWHHKKNGARKLYSKM